MKNFLLYKSGKLGKTIKPTKVIVTVFLALILIGTVLLSLPISSRSGEFTPFLTALFTATSATCVTGLVLVDTYQYWNGFGQIVILLLIQIGGLGFMTITTLFSFFVGRTITLKERLVMSTSLNVDDVSGVVKLTKRLLLGTLFFEALGAILLSIRFASDFGIAGGIKKGIFHSVSAFCNAGFDLLGSFGAFSSLTGYSSDVVVNFTIMALVILGGLGFYVWSDILNKNGLSKLEFHSKVVLITSAALIISGAVFFTIFEWNNTATLGDMNVLEKLLAGLFQSVTTRTAGFNTVDQGALTGPSNALTLVFMFIGGSPGSTAGGIKTTTIAVLILTAISTFRGKSSVTYNYKTIPTRTIMNAVSFLILGAVITFFGAIIISASDAVTFSDALYEAVSAFGTVGLSTGITSTLGVISKLTLILLMFLGRVGVMTLGIAVFMGQTSEAKIKYTSAKIMIG